MKDITGMTITENQLLVNSSRQHFNTFIDPDLGLSIKNIDTGTIEKLFPEVAEQLMVAAIYFQGKAIQI